MAYQVLARKWRPQNFASLVGQQPIVTALRNALLEGRIAQAYLFSGIRGVGKTTAARVLAKALNCERGPAADPCNECTACIEITRGSDLDVIEVDAATYSKVEQVRELTESLKYGPARDRYKVVVLDEIHRLSRQAFDALLKIVEEPPPHLVFIFATTEIEAVPATILSRCQELHFRRVPGQEVAALLHEICAAESIQASDAALRLVARAGEGSVRDAVALLDQLATFGSGTITDDAAVHLLGGLDVALFRQLLAAILAGDAAGVAGLARHIEEEGWDPRHVYSQFLGFCRDALHLALGGRPDQVDMSLEEAEALAAAARGAGYENLLRMLNQLLASEAVVRRSESGALAVEIAWLRAAELPKLTRVEELLGGARIPESPAAGVSGGAATPGRRGGESGPPAQGPSPALASGAPGLGAAPESAAPGPNPPVGSATPNADSAVGAGAPVAGAADRNLIGRFLEEISKRKQPLAAHLEGAEDLRFEDGRLVVVLPPGDTYLGARLRQPANRQVIEEAIAKVWGPDTGWECAAGQGAAAQSARASSPSTASSATPATPGAIGLEGREAAAGTTTAVAIESNPTVQTILDIFGGRVERVEEHGSPRED
ncbi:MAG TPA: DNA polymerase III subunit gamma/tau [Thermoanaerobaculia bacterium]|nr:DNA polymerase III subunit gamma/tau [Thermoanaerobaculia bacterium]